MANPHHRPKHKDYVHHKHQAQQHQHHVQSSSIKTNKKAAIPLAIVGAVAGLLVAYIANKESIAVLFIGLAIGAFAGYFFGKSMDNTLDKKK